MWACPPPNVTVCAGFAAALVIKLFPPTSTPLPPCHTHRGTHPGGASVDGLTV